MFRDLFSLSKFLFLSKRRFSHWTSSQIQMYQRKATRSIVSYAFHHSPFYAKYYCSSLSEDFFSLPFMNKSLYMENFTSLNTKGLTKEECIDYCLRVEQSRDFSQYYKGYLIGMSTGTSGNKSIEFASKFETFLMQYLIFSRFPFPKARKLHVAFILRVFSPGFSHNSAKLRISYVSPLNPLEKIISELHALQPNVLSGPPSILQVLAQARSSGSLLINPLTIVSYGEVLSPDVKAFLTQKFECPVMEVYKSSESLMAISCKHGNLHINEDTTLVEVHDRHNHPLPSGMSGFVVVTDFIKHGTPIIRYQLNDLITIDTEQCPCGSHFRVIKQVHGRADDILLGKSLKSDDFQFILPDFISRSIVRSSPFIEEYHAIQTSPTNFTIKLQLQSPLVDNLDIKTELELLIQHYVESIFTNHECSPPKITFQYELLTHDFNKKLRRIRREFALDYLKSNM